MNTQPIERRDYSDDGSLEVHSIFPTIQGEGLFSGVAATFVRLAGCNLQCPHCDTDYTSNRKRLSPLQIFNEVRSASTRHLVVITGGEPFRQDITPLVRLLSDNGYAVQIESNGTMEIPVDFPSHNVHICISPKTPRIHPSAELRASYFKYVVEAGNVAPNGLPLTALGHRAKPNVYHPDPWEKRTIYIQPQDSKNGIANHANMQACIEIAKKHSVVLQVQLHKLLGVE